VVIVSRPHNFERVAATVRGCQPRAVLVYDCEALFWRRMLRQAKLSLDDDERAGLEEAAARMRALEERIVVESDFAVTVSQEEAELLREVPGCCPVQPMLPAEPEVHPGTQGFAERHGAAYVAGWMAGSTSPNANGLRWFASEVLPLVRQSIPWVRVCVTGANPPDDILALADPNVFFEGHVADLAAFYARHRVVIAPIRFGAGVKVKTVQALQHGVPVVSTTCGAEGIETFGLDAIAVADTPRSFAASLVSLLTDASAWNARRSAIAALVACWQRPGSSGSWSDVMDSALAGRKGGRDALLHARRS